MTTRACQKAGVAQTDHCVGGGGLVEKIPQVQDLDAAGKAANIPEKVRECKTDRKDREASNQADKEVFCLRKKFLKQKKLTNHAMQQARDRQLRKKFHNWEEPTNHEMQQAKNKTVPEKVREPKADRKDRKASNQAGKEVFCLRKKFLKQKELTNHAMQQRKQELLKEIEKQQGGDRKSKGRHRPLDRKTAATDAGLSERQAKQLEVLSMIDKTSEPKHDTQGMR